MLRAAKATCVVMHTALEYLGSPHSRCNSHIHTNWKGQMPKDLLIGNTDLKEVNTHSFLTAYRAIACPAALRTLLAFTSIGCC